MGLWSKAFGTKGDSQSSANGQPTQGKKLQAVLVVTPRPLNNAQQLLQQIVDQQKSAGYGIAPGLIATTRVGNNSDQQYVYAMIRQEFAQFGAADVIDRTQFKTFQASDGNQGTYYMLFDRA